MWLPQVQRGLRGVPVLGRLVREPGPPPQRFFAQCDRCSNLQSQVLRRGPRLAAGDARVARS